MISLHKDYNNVTKWNTVMLQHISNEPSRSQILETGKSHLSDVGDLLIMDAESIPPLLNMLNVLKGNYMG